MTLPKDALMPMWTDHHRDALGERRFPLLSVMLAAGITFGAAANADDTEVFFGQDSSQANVLFVVDVSGSMREVDDGTTTRLDRVKAAMNELLSTTSDINVGLLSYTSDGNYLHQEIRPVTENRGEMLASIESLAHGGYTPTVGALLEAAQYFRGEELSSMGRAYDTPIQSACQSNHIVLLTDGSPTEDASDDVEPVIYSNGESCTDADPEAGTCGAELADWLSVTDHADPVADTNSIITHTIGFNFSSEWLPSVSSAGGGQHFTADSASALLSAFDSILEVAGDSNNTFAAPAISLDQITRLSHRDDMYLALFEPSNTVRWPGNLKRYRFDGKVRDKKGQVAIDLSTGTIKDSAQGFWSTTEDGAVVTAGGAANLIDINQPRAVYTYTGSEMKDLRDSVNKLHENNTDVTAGMLGVPESERSNLLQWSRGVDVDDEFAGDTRTQMGDPLHSRPAVLTYGGTADTPNSVIFVGTNEGYLHAINSEDGKEVFAFVPPELLPNLDAYYKNERTINRVYGLDGDLTLWVRDINYDGAVVKDDGDRAYLYMGMRRGGRNYTALDVTTKNDPKFLWSINSDDTGFEKLGQSWSKPTLGRIAVNGVHKNVLIFAGGYNPMQDNANFRSSDPIGNDLFIVDANDGTLLWNTAKKSDDFAAMEYSIPSDPRVIDMNGDGLVDQIYVGDMGGQVWRLDIDNNATTDDPSVSGGVIANLAGDDAVNNRRFFYAPDVALVSDGTRQFLSVSIGSGNRAHPLDTTVDDRFYMIRQHSLFKAPEGYGIKGEDDKYRAITEDDLYDATGNLINSTDVTIANQEVDKLNKEDGWLLSLSVGGEKVLAPSVTLNNNVVFTTYIPEQTANDDCSPATGGGRMYSVSVLNATPTTGLTKDDRFDPLLSSGIPAEPTPHIDEDGNLRIVIGYEDKALPSVKLVRRVYWTEQPDY